MQTTTSVDTLQRMITDLARGQSKYVVGIDGMNGTGKTTLATRLETDLDGTHIELDDFLEHERMDKYLEHISCKNLIVAIEKSHSPILLDGICLRAIEEKCDLGADIHVYVRRISSTGIWHDDDICLATKPANELKQGESALGQILIDYHHQYHPFEQADIVFDRME